MPKINQEEYEILKGLDDRWKWIARDDKESIFFNNDVCAFQNIPLRERGYWINNDDEHKQLSRDLFQFIQWEDEEPYNIQELIEEYEENYKGSWEHAIEFSKEMRRESEETEVKKDIEWLKEWLDEYEDETFNEIGDIRTNGDFRGRLREGPLMRELLAITNVQEKLAQLDEPEVLSQEWIDEHSNGPSRSRYVWVDDLKELLVPKQEVTFKQACDKIAEIFPATAKEIVSVLEKYYSGMFIEFSEELHESIMRAFDVETTSKTIEALTGMTLEQIAEEARNGGIVPKQEEVKVPQFIANYLPLVKEDIELERASYYAVTNNELPKWKKEYDWIRENFETFVKAWLAYPNIEVEEEQGWIIREKGTNFVLNSLDVKAKDAKSTLDISTGWSPADLKGFVFESEETANSIANLLGQHVKVEELEE